jgi:hypothetical protein
MEGTKDVAEEDGTPEASEDEDVAAPKAGLHGRETAPRVPIPKPPEPPEPPEPLEPPLIEPPNAPTAGGPPKPAMEPAMATARSPLEPDGDEDGAAEVEGVDDEWRQILVEAAELDDIWGVWEAKKEPTNVPGRWNMQPFQSGDDMRHHVEVVSPLVYPRVRLFH